MVPSYSESFGLVAVEAQACGTPVIAASVGGLRTAVQDGVSGILVDGHDPASYARALCGTCSAPPAGWPGCARGAARARLPVRLGRDRRLACSQVYTGSHDADAPPPLMPSADGARDHGARSHGSPETTEPGGHGASDRRQAGGQRSRRRWPGLGPGLRVARSRALPGAAGGPAQAGHDDLADRRRAQPARGGVLLPPAGREPRPLLPVPAGAQRPHVRRPLRAGPRRGRLPGRAAAAARRSRRTRSTGSSAACSATPTRTSTRR